MKIIFTFLFLFFTSKIFADDISDFQIEGMSIGDSLLDYYNEIEINNYFKIGLYYEEFAEFIIYETKNKISNNFEDYDGLQIVFKRNDNNLIIQSIGGNIIYENNINECYKKMNEIDLEFKNIFSKLKRTDWGIIDTSDKSGNYKPITFDFNNGDRIMIACYDFTKNNWIDNLKISLYTKEYRDFIKQYHNKN